MPDPVGVGRAAQGDDILAGQVGDAYLVGGDEADDGGALQRGERGEGLAAEPDLAGGRAQPGDRPQQGAFARPVAAYERRDRPLREHGVGVAQQDAAAVGEGEAVQRDARCPGCGAGVRSGGMEGVGCHFRRGCGCGRRR